jgi:cold shock CspA family protein
MPDFGTVKLYKSSEGYGFIEAEDGGPDIFVHHSAIKMNGFRYLSPGERVIFESEDAPHDAAGRPRRRATMVTEPPGRVAGTVAQFDAHKGYGFIKTDDGERVFVHYTDIFGWGTRSVAPNERVTFFIERGDGHRTRKAVQVKQSDHRPELYRFAQFPPRMHWLRRLADLAEHEDWSFQQQQRGDEEEVAPILHHYIVNTFAKLKEQADRGEPTITETQRQGRRWACFDTGLVTAQQQHIYAVFEENRNPQLAPWLWRDCCTVSDRLLSCRSHDPLPARATYYHDHRQLTYDQTLDLTLDYDRVLATHLHERFPEALRTAPALARDALIAADAQIKDRVKRDNKTAVAQYWRGHIQLLLPLCLQQDTTADLALVVEKDRDTEAYHATTVLPLDIAYMNARLLGRPDSDWLNPNTRDTPHKPTHPDRA